MVSQIREISIDEVAIISDLAHKIWPATFYAILSRHQMEYMLAWMYSEEELKKQLTTGHRFFVMFFGDIPVGFMGIQCFFPKHQQMKIHKLYVLPEIQGHGAGRKFFDLSLKIALENGMNEITLNVNRFNKAVGFYQSMGFTVERAEDIEIGNGYLMEDFVMTLSL